MSAEIHSGELGSPIIEHDQRKQKLELRLTRIQYILGLIALVHVIAFVVGALLGFVYLLRHQFNPGGITGSDTLAMVLWSLGFAVTLGFGLGMATISGFPAARALHFVVKGFANILRSFKREDTFPLSEFWWSVHYGWPNRLEWLQGQWLFMLVGCLGLAFLGGLIFELPWEQGSFFFTMLSVGMLLSLVVFGKMVGSYEYWPRRDVVHSIDIRMQRLTARKRSFIVAFVVVASMTTLNLGTWIDASATLIGFREQDVSVRLAKEDFDELIEQAARGGVVINPCEEIPAGSSTLRHADILWQNLGARSLLRFPSRPLGINTGDAGIIRLKTSNTSLASVVVGGLPLNAGNSWQIRSSLKVQRSCATAGLPVWLSNYLGYGTGPLDGR